MKFITFLLVFFIFHKPLFASNITELEFKSYVTAYQEALSDYVHEMTSHKLVINADWENPVKTGGGAGAKRYPETQELHLRLDGGLVRNDAITIDAVSFVLCHELGHAIAAFPDIEGEIDSDIYAISECLLELWSNNSDVGNPDEVLTESRNLPVNLSNDCSKQSGAKKLFCERIIRSIYSGNLYRYDASPDRWDEPLFDTPVQTGYGSKKLQCMFNVGLATTTGQRLPECYLDL